MSSGARRACTSGSTPQTSSPPTTTPPTADLEAADLITADGQSVVWGARQFGIDVPERVTGIDLMDHLLDASRTRGWGVYLLGAKPETVVRLAVRLRDAGVQVDGYRDGYFTDAASDAVAAEVRRSGATLLFVGTPSPRKERFMIGHARTAGVPFSIGVGGAFDVLAGELSRAPRVMQRGGMEWLFRLLQEPRRLFGRYAATNTRYLLLLAQAASRRRLRLGRWTPFDAGPRGHGSRSCSACWPWRPRS